MTAPEVVVVGSLNMDVVARAPHLVVPGETVLGHSFVTAPGGKGANQAVAAARLGARTAMVGRVGDDAFGARLRAGLEADGVDVGGVGTAPGVSTGVAVIVVDDDGRNGIVVVPGANGLVTPADVDAREEALAAARVVVLQLEIPLATVEHAVRRARALGKTVVLNPAPARPLPPALVACADLLVPNEIEAAALAGAPVASIEDAIEAGRRLRAGGAGAVLVTLGERGVVTVGPDGVRHAPAPAVRAVDSTAAGDTFIGGLCAALVRGRPLAAAVAFGQAAAAISVTRAGAQPSIPYLREVPVTE
ncbi:MAG TPA: ribokinase [Anaeromyxobacteraceae bacterium]|nr:ribokinase [Anaeromyxobacteraceae bacterium]